MKRLGILVALVALGLAAYFALSRDAPAPAAWQGYAAGDDVFVGPAQPGTLARVAVARGEHVAKGALLFAQDATGDIAAVEQAQASLAQAVATLANLEQQGGRADEVAQAEATLADKTAVRIRDAADLLRSERLLAGHAVSQQAVDAARQALTSATAQEAGAAANLALLRQPLGRPSQIAAQRAAVAAARAALAQARWQLSQRTVVAPDSGVVVDVVARAGEALTAGATVVDLLPDSARKVLFFVPEPALSSRHLGETVVVSCDGCGKGLTARISYIASKPEYTPPVIYSRSTRAGLVYRIEATPPAAQRILLHPGQPLDVHPERTAP